MAKDKVIRDSDLEYAEYKKCLAQDFPKDKVKKLVVTCIPCNKRVELPIDSCMLTFDSVKDGKCRRIQLNEFVAYPHIMCKDCLGVADIEVI